MGERESAREAVRGAPRLVPSERLPRGRDAGDGAAARPGAAHRPVRGRQPLSAHQPGVHDEAAAGRSRLPAHLPALQGLPRRAGLADAQPRVHDARAVPPGRGLRADHARHRRGAQRGRRPVRGGALRAAHGARRDAAARGRRLDEARRRRVVREGRAGAESQRRHVGRRLLSHLPRPRGAEARAAHVHHRVPGVDGFAREDARRASPSGSSSTRAESSSRTASPSSTTRRSSAGASKTSSGSAGRRAGRRSPSTRSSSRRWGACLSARASRSASIGC